MRVDELVERSHWQSKEAGWWDAYEAVEDWVPEELDVRQQVIAEILCGKVALIHTEITEAQVEWMKGNVCTVVENGKPEGYGIEIADVLIRLADLAGAMDINILDNPNYTDYEGLFPYKTASITELAQYLVTAPQSLPLLMQAALDMNEQFHQMNRMASHITESLRGSGRAKGEVREEMKNLLFSALFSVHLAERNVTNNIGHGDTCLGFMIETCLERKLDFNLTRKYRHGGKLA